MRELPDAMVIPTGREALLRARWQAQHIQPADPPPRPVGRAPVLQRRLVRILEDGRERTLSDLLHRLGRPDTRPARNNLRNTLSRMRAEGTIAQEELEGIILYRGQRWA